MMEHGTHSETRLDTHPEADPRVDLQTTNDFLAGELRRVTAERDRLDRRNVELEAANEQLGNERKGLSDRAVRQDDEIVRLKNLLSRGGAPA